MDRGFVLTDERLHTNVPERLRGRRHRARPAARAPRLPAGHLCGRGDRGARTRRSSTRPASPGSPTPTRSRLRRPHRGEAKERYGADKIKTYTYNLGGNGKSQILKTQGFVKLVRVEDGPVVGIHMVGARVGELIGEAQLIYNWEASRRGGPSRHAHPTQGEALGEAHLALAASPCTRTPDTQLRGPSARRAWPAQRHKGVLRRCGMGNDARVGESVTERLSPAG